MNPATLVIAKRVVIALIASGVLWANRKFGLGLDPDSVAGNAATILVDLVAAILLQRSGAKSQAQLDAAKAGEVAKANIKSLDDALKVIQGGEKKE